MRDSLRAIRSRAGFAAAIVLVLGLCLGANSALFTVVNSLLLRPLPFPNNEQLVEVSIGEQRVPVESLEGAGSVESAGAFLSSGFAVKGTDGVRNTFGFRVTRDLVPLLGFSPALGRSLTREDFGKHVVMISHEHWKSLGARADIEGQVLTVDGVAYFVAGVLPADFFLSVRDAMLIVPDLRSGGRTLARLHAGVTAATAQADISTVLPGRGVQVTPLAQAFQGSDSRPVLMLLATAGFVLLITCANLANLQLVRGLARRREFAIRTAIGASHGRLVMQLAGESALLGAAGAAAGLVLTRVLHDAILAMLPANVGRRMSGADALAMDSRVLLFTGGMAMITVLLFGLIPGLISLRFDVIARLRDAARGSGGDRHRFGQTLVAIEIALAMMLLAGAALSFKSLTQMQDQYLGFRGEGVLRSMVGFSESQHSRQEQKVAVYREVERRISQIAGVASVGIVAPQVFPFGGPGVRGSYFEIFGSPGVGARAEVYTANPMYLDSIRLPLLRGRWFTDSDTAASQPVAVVSESVANRYWGAQECLGRKVRLNSDRPESEWSTIIGVVGDVKNPTGTQWQPTAYRPFAQTPSSGATLMIRSSLGDPRSLVTSVRREVHAIDATAPELRLVDALDAAVRDYVSPQRFTASLLGLFAAIGLALAAAGVYGVMQYWVASRTGEIGIRLALGAQPGKVLRMVLGRAITAAAVGVIAGITGAIALRKVISALLIGVSPTDPVILTGVAAAIMAVAATAAWIPAKRASWIDPAVALRSE